MGCATHALVENILSIIAASVLLYFNTMFLNNPYTCLFGSAYDCSVLNYNSNYYGSYSTFSNNGIYSTTGYTVKLACIKAQLACAAVMLFTCVVYIIIYIVVAVRLRNIDNTPGATNHGYAMQPVHRVVPMNVYPGIANQAWIHPAPPAPVILQPVPGTNVRLWIRESLSLMRVFFFSSGRSKFYSLSRMSITDPDSKRCPASTTTHDGSRRIFHTRSTRTSCPQNGFCSSASTTKNGIAIIGT